MSENTEKKRSPKHQLDAVVRQVEAYILQQEGYKQTQIDLKPLHNKYDEAKKHLQYVLDEWKSLKISKTPKYRIVRRTITEEVMPV